MRLQQMPMTTYPKPPFPKQTQKQPGRIAEMDPPPDHGEESYRSTGCLTGLVALFTGADSGIGRAVAIAFACEGVDVAISYLSETDDATETTQLVRAAERKSLALTGDIAYFERRRRLTAGGVAKLGRIDILVNNAAHKVTFEDLGEISDEEWRRTIAVNIDAMFWLVKAAVPQMASGGPIIKTTSINAGKTKPDAAGLCDDQGVHPELYQRIGTNVGIKGDTGQLRGTGSGVDAADPVDHAG